MFKLSKFAFAGVLDSFFDNILTQMNKVCAPRKPRAAFHRLHEFWRQHIVDDVQMEMDSCFDCNVMDCTEDRYNECAPRKARADELQCAPRKAAATIGIDLAARVCADLNSINQYQTRPEAAKNGFQDRDRKASAQAVKLSRSISHQETLASDR